MRANNRELVRSNKGANTEVLDTSSLVYLSSRMWVKNQDVACAPSLSGDPTVNERQRILPWDLKIDSPSGKL